MPVNQKYKILSDFKVVNFVHVYRDKRKWDLAYKCPMGVLAFHRGTMPPTLPVLPAMKSQRSTSLACLPENCCTT